MEKPQGNSLRISNGFLMPLPVRIFGSVLAAAGIYGAFFTPLVGIILFFAGISVWTFFQSVDFFYAEEIMYREYKFLGITVKKESKKIEINHITFQRLHATTKVGVKGAQSHTTSDEFYNVILIYNHREKEVLHSVSDLEEGKKIAFDLAIKLGVNIFYAASNPQKWIDPVTGKETIPEFKKSRR